jgi:hypothetical protein
MTDAAAHLETCADCGRQFEEFRRTYAMLKASPDGDPPRPMVFRVESRRAVSWIWRWAGPMAAAAALALAILTFAPRRQTLVERVVVQQPAPAAVETAGRPVDIDRIIAEVRSSQQAWLAGELKKRDAVQIREIQSLRGQVAFLEAQQRKVLKETIDNASSIQLLAHR